MRIGWDGKEKILMLLIYQQLYVFIKITPYLSRLWCARGGA
jgi:hypothetical protein